MTPRLISGLFKVINKSKLTDFYESAVSYKAWADGKIPSLSEFLSSNLKHEPDIVFDEKTDKILEEQALKRFEERLKKHGQ